MYLKEDLMIKESAMRNLLWPLIDKAQKKGKQAFFVGIKAIDVSKKKQKTFKTTALFKMGFES